MQATNKQAGLACSLQHLLIGYKLETRLGLYTQKQELKPDSPHKLLRRLQTGPEYPCQVKPLISLLRGAQDRGVPEGEYADEGACA